MPSTQPEASRCRIDIAHLSKTFLADGRDVVAVDDVSFRIDDGEFVALLGPSGCGKSTILNMVATLIAPNGGSIRVDSQPVVPGRPIAQVGYVFQKDTLFPWRTVEGNIGYALCQQVKHHPNTPSNDAFGHSFFARVAPIPQLGGFVRLDLWQPDRRLAKRVDQRLWIVGLDWQPVKDVHVMPNLEAMEYVARGGAVVPPHHDVQARMTFYWKFSRPQ